MATRQEIVAFIKSNPNCTTEDISKYFGFPTGVAPSRVKQLFDLAYVTRTVKHLNSRGNPVYQYVVPASTEGKPKQERIAIVQPTQPSRKANDSLSLDDMLGQFVSSFASSIVTSIVGQLKPRLEAELMKALPQLTSHKATPPPPQVIQKVRLPKIGILGVQVPKRNAINAEFNTIFDITYWTSDDGENRLKSMAMSCEIIYVMDYVSHKHTQLLSARGANLFRIRGDIMALTEALTNRYLKEAA